jgi:hypothetical protein
MGDILRLAVFEYLEVRGLQICNVVTLRIGDYRIQLDRIDSHSDHGSGGLLTGSLRFERRRREQHRHQADGSGVQ